MEERATMQLETSAIAGIMIPEALTPGQYYEGIRSDDASVRPIKRLMLAVLEDAMRCYQAYADSRSCAQRRLFVEAEAWFMDRKADGAFAFETVCETLGIEPSCLRQGLRRWRLQQLDGMNPRRLARRSPVTGVGRISAPLKRRRRRPASAAGGDDRSLAVAIDGNVNGNGIACGGIADDGLGYYRCVEIEDIDRADAAASADASVSARIAIQETAPAPL